jgi:glycosyltransferase involved in cell wall biosynthesis
MHILICNERFLFRFGLDRALIILGNGLKELGHTISIIANKYDRHVLEAFATTIIDIPETDYDYLNSNESTEKWLNKNWDVFFSDSNKPDIVLIGGWPFFSSIQVFQKYRIPVIFFDCGAVPLTGYTNGFLILQKKLQELRKKYLQQVTAIIAISDFIATSQSKVDSNNQIPVFTILLGADHLDLKIWQKNAMHKKNSMITFFDSIKNKGKLCILNLGRWEPNCYKNSEAIFEIMRKIKTNYPNSGLFVLCDPPTIQIPQDLQNFVYPIGFPDDTELTYLMNNMDLGISTSLWEGFNLPLSEMQWLNVPVLVFNKGAHPEVVLHPWYLCNDNDEMATKACEIFEGNDLNFNIKINALNKFHEFFTWKRVIVEFDKVFENVVNSYQNFVNQNFLAIIDVTNAVRDPANSGVIRVTRRVCCEFQKYTQVLFVVWDQEKKQYFFPTKTEFNQLSQFNGPVLTNECRISVDNNKWALSDYLKTSERAEIWLIFTETIDESRAKKIRHFARENNIYLAAIFYDAIPVLFPEFCQDTVIKNNHIHYMRGLADCDIVIPISRYSSECLQKFWNNQNINGGSVQYNLLPGEFGGFKRIKTIQNFNHDKINILCVSTLEPRKNHKTLIQACLLMQERHPELDWTLTLVGNRYAGAFDIANDIEKISKENPRIQWLGVVSDYTLNLLYKKATFTIYPSIVEGFGIPILESIWQGKPVICSNQGVMAELAVEGGCLTTDIQDTKQLANAIYRLCTDEMLIFNLSQEAIKRPIKTWDEYMQQLLSILIIKNAAQTSPRIPLKYTGKNTFSNFEEILYPMCLCENWQMNHSERIALTGLLLRHKPHCSIEIGTYKAGSLSLISQVSNIVYSLDIDPDIPKKFGQFKNVTFLTGSSTTSLPLLLKALDYEHVPVDFILIDGDHSAEGVKRDLNSVLAYIPKKPLFIMMHDSFNPECRKGMLEANWNSSRYVQWVDLDFVPGRITENSIASQGEMWGGLALAYLTPAIRSGPLTIERTANKMYEFLKTFSQRGHV